MSYSISECIADREASLVAARAVQERFPDVEMRVLWKGGPRVFVSASVEPTDVLVRVEENMHREPEPRLFSYAEHGGAVVFSAHWHGAALWSVMDRLKKTAPAVYAAIVAATEQEAR